MRLGLGLSADSITSQKIGAGFTGILDEYSGAVAAYSVRRLSSSYTDSLIRVRRSSDETEQDIGFDSNGDLDTTALLAFVGNKNLFKHSDPATGDTRVMSGTITSSANDWGLGFNNKLIFAATIPSTEVVYDADVEASTQYTLAVRVKFPNGETIDATKFGSGSGKYFYFIAGAGAISSGYSVTELDTNTYLVQVTTTTGSASNSVGIVRTTANDGAAMEMTGFQINEGDTLLSYTATDGGVSGDGHVTTWYDQSGNDNRATAASAAVQPLVVSGGSIIYEGATTSRPAIDFDGVDDKLGFASNLNIGGSPSIIGVLKSPAGDIAWRGGGSDYWYFAASDSFRVRIGDFDTYFTNGDGVQDITDSQKLIATYKNSTNVELTVDGASKGTKSSGTGADGYFNNIGSDLAGYVIDGVWQELIIYTSDQSSNRTGIESNINDHFDIYTP